MAWGAGMVQCEPCRAVETAQHKHHEGLRKRNGDSWFPTRFMKWFPRRHDQEVPRG